MAETIARTQSLFTGSGRVRGWPRAAAPETAEEVGRAQPPQTETAAAAPEADGAGLDALKAQQAAEQALRALTPETPDAGSAEARETPQGEAADALSALTDALAQRDGEAKTLIEMMEDAKAQAEELRKRFELPKNTSQYSLAAVEAFARLSRARTQSDVSAAAGYARRQLVQCRAALKQDGGNPQRIRAAIRQLESAVARAGRKKRDLEDERLTEQRRARAARENDLKKARRLKYELRRCQTSRMLRENSYVRGAVTDAMQQAQLEQMRAEQQAQLEHVAGLGSPQADAAASAYQAMAAPAGAAPAAQPPSVEVSV